jgi:cell division protein ZapA
MSESSVQTLDVKILDREFRVSCTEDEKAELLQAVSYLDGKMRHIRDNGKVVSVERIAIMAALNIAHELLATKVGGSLDVSEYKRRLQALQTIVDSALADQDKLFE